MNHRRARSTRAGEVLLAVALLACGSPTLAQMSPGPLSRAHRQLDGALKCLECHARGERTMEDQCLACHTEIAWLVRNDRGLHARNRTEECATCHTEHLGADASLTQFDEGDPRNFNHARTGWPLTGKHTSIECRECHRPERQASEAFRLAQRKNRQGSYIGLETECAACHEDPHRGSLGNACRECHIPVAWKSTPGFDHAATGYPLTGRHAEIRCQQCHRERASDGSGATVYRKLRHQECSDCHDDVHRERLGPVCSSCHVTESFRQVKQGAFDHGRTGYPLEGKHRQVECQQCHPQTTTHADGGGANARMMRPRHERCLDCHRPAHGDQLSSREALADCSSCHRVTGWTPSTYSVERHAGLGFPLEGKHASTACAACHRPGQKVPIAITAKELGSAGVAFDFDESSCETCHLDPHQGQFTGNEASKAPSCRICHGFDAFRPSIVDATIHDDFEFPLEGAHDGVRCEKCHKEIDASRPSVGSSLRVATRERAALTFDADGECAACHEGPHGDQFAARRDAGACQACHGHDAFRPASRFQHDRHTRFPLLRAHRDAACGDCHDSRVEDGGKVVVVYRPVPFGCKECHRAKGVKGGRG